MKSSYIKTHHTALQQNKQKTCRSELKEIIRHAKENNGDLMAVKLHSIIQLS